MVYENRYINSNISIFHALSRTKLCIIPIPYFLHTLYVSEKKIMSAYYQCVYVYRAMKLVKKVFTIYNVKYNKIPISYHEAEEKRLLPLFSHF